MFAYPVAGHVGNGALITFGSNSTGDARWAHDPVTVTPGTTYTYSNWYKSNVATEIDIQYINSSGSSSWGWVASLPSSNNTWQQVTANITIPSGTTKIVVFHLIDKTGTLIVDDFSLTSGAVSPPPPPPPGAPTLTLSANPTTITAGQQSTLTWNSTNTTSCTASNGWTGSKALSGNETVSPAATATYVLSCTGAGGNISQQVTVTVNAVPPPPPPGGFSEGMVTLSFDDSWTSQYTTALPILQTAGFKGTFYLTTEPIQEGWDDFMTPNQVKTIAQQGHEIAGHTVTHADLTTLSRNRINQEIKNSKTYLQNLTGAIVTSFAYPYGSLNNTIKTLLKNAGYTAARGVDYETLNTATTDKFDLKSQCIETGDSMASIKAQIDAAKANKQWYILCIHEVKNGGDQYSTTPARFQEIVDYITSTGIKVVTVKEGRALMSN